MIFLINNGVYAIINFNEYYNYSTYKFKINYVYNKKIKIVFVVLNIYYAQKNYFLINNLFFIIYWY